VTLRGDWNENGGGERVIIKTFAEVSMWEGEHQNMKDGYVLSNSQNKLMENLELIKVNHRNSSRNSGVFC
jgi:hypothetical protein